jgi:hypothetical protein
LRTPAATPAVYFAERGRDDKDVVEPRTAIGALGAPWRPGARAATAIESAERGQVDARLEQHPPAPG